jgi:hypothetical protein
MIPTTLLYEYHGMKYEKKMMMDMLQSQRDRRDEGRIYTIHIDMYLK